MQAQRPLTAFEGTKKDFQESWKLLKANYRAFLGTFLFAILAAVITIVLIMIFSQIFETELDLQFSQGWFFSTQYRWIALSIAYLILITFINCQTGLAHDIMSSGEMFAEFKSSFTYFRNHWWKYILSTIFLGGFQVWISIKPPWRLNLNQNVTDIENNNSNILDVFTIGEILIILIIILFIFIFMYIWAAIFSQMLASINAQGHFIQGIKESWQIFWSNPKRVLSTWGIFNIIFILPGFLIEGFTIIYAQALPNANWVFVIIYITWNFFVIYIGLPLRALLMTGLYNNLKKE